MIKKSALESIEIIVGHAKTPKYAVIWLHGLGADGNDFVPIIEQLDLTNLAIQHGSIKFIFPHAPERPITINQGMRMRAWYDIVGMELADKQDEEGIKQSAALIENLVNQQLEQGIKLDNIVLAGFSQGGAMALYLALSKQWSLAGVLALSCYLPLAEQVLPFIAKKSQSTPILMMHGTLDPVVSVQFGKLAKEQLEKKGLMVEWKEYAMGHEVCYEQIQVIST